MPLYQEKIFHDRQSISTTVTETTTSATFVDVPNTEITTKDLSQPASYLGISSVLLSATQNNTMAKFRAVLDEIPVGNEAEIELKIKDQDGIKYF